MSKISRKTQDRSRIGLFVCAMLLFACQLQAGVRIAVGGNEEEIASFKEENVEYLSLNELAGILGGRVDWELVGHEVCYRAEQFQMNFYIESPYFRIDDSIYNMTYGCRLKRGQLYVPAKTFLPFLDKFLPEKVAFDERKNTIKVASNEFTVSDLAFIPKANGLLIELFLSEPVGYDIYITEGNWINITLRNATLNMPQIESRADNRIVHKVTTHQHARSSQVSIQLKKKIEQYHHKLTEEPYRIQLSFPDLNFDIEHFSETEPADEFRSYTPETEIAVPHPATPEQITSIGPDGFVDIVVIDAGHGGTEYGAIGQRGTREKDVTLSIAKAVASRFRKDKRFRIVMTRESDVTVPLQRRADIANAAKADLFVSIHANASPKRDARGWNVFFLATAKNDSARATEQLENSYFLREFASASQPEQDADPVVSILSDMIMTEFQSESHDLALMLDREMRNNLTIPARGVDQAGFFVLNKIYMPSLLVETAFISNKSEERLLKDKRFHAQIAESIFDAVVRFKEKYESQ